MGNITSLDELIGTEYYAYPAEAKTLVVKFGTGCFVADGRNDLLDQDKINNAANVLTLLKQQEKHVIGVVSGAVVKGMEYEGLHERPEDVPYLQYLASKGQSGFMEMFMRAFKPYGITPLQGLPTRHNFATIKERKNLQKQFNLSFNDETGIYLMNTNDFVTNEELLLDFAKNHPDLADKKLMSTDNDVLAFLVAKYAKANALIMASEPGPNIGSGGGRSKMNVASEAISSGIYFAIGTLDKISHLAVGWDTGTKFLPNKWAKNPEPQYIGNEAYVSADFMKKFDEANPGRMSATGKILRIINVDSNDADYSIECIYTMRQPKEIPFYRLTLSSINRRQEFY